MADLTETTRPGYGTAGIGDHLAALADQERACLLRASVHRIEDRASVSSGTELGR